MEKRRYLIKGCDLMLIDPTTGRPFIAREGDLVELAEAEAAQMSLSRWLVPAENQPPAEPASDPSPTPPAENPPPEPTPLPMLPAENPPPKPPAEDSPPKPKATAAPKSTTTIKRKK